MNLPFKSDFYPVLQADCENAQEQIFESSTQAAPIEESSGKKRKLSIENSTDLQEESPNPQELSLNFQEISANPLEIFTKSQEVSSNISDSSTIKQECSSKFPEFSTNPSEVSSNLQEMSRGQFFIPVISESGDPLYNLPVLTVEESGEDATRPAKKVLTEKELKALRMQMAMLSDIDGDRPIHVAVVQENVKIARKMCALMSKVGISVDITNYNRQTPLHLSVMVGNKEMVKLLLKCGARVSQRDRRGNTALHLAVKSNAKKEILAIILDHSDAKSIINMLDYEGYSALHYAVIKSNENLVKCFHQYKANMNVPDGKSGRSPLLHAIVRQNAEMVRILFECGAAPDFTDYSGRTPFELALLTSNKTIAKIVEKNMTSANTTKSKSNDMNYRTLERLPKLERRSQRSKRVCRSNTYPDYEVT